VAFKEQFNHFLVRFNGNVIQVAKEETVVILCPGHSNLAVSTRTALLGGYIALHLVPEEQFHMTPHFPLGSLWHLSPRPRVHLAPLLWVTVQYPPVLFVKRVSILFKVLDIFIQKLNLNLSSTNGSSDAPNSALEGSFLSRPVYRYMIAVSNLQWTRREKKKKRKKKQRKKNDAQQ
jgi:hypothetical protein